MHVQKGNRLDNLNGTQELDFKQFQVEGSRTLRKIGSRFLCNGAQIKHNPRDSPRIFSYHQRTALMPWVGKEGGGLPSGASKMAAKEIINHKRAN